MIKAVDLAFALDSRFGLMRMQRFAPILVVTAGLLSTAPVHTQRLVRVRVDDTAIEIFDALPVARLGAGIVPPPNAGTEGFLGCDVSSGIAIDILGALQIAQYEAGLSVASPDETPFVCGVGRDAAHRV